MIEKYLKKTDFSSHKDFIENYDIIVPNNFNFAYNIVDEWAKTDPDKRALCWTNDVGDNIDLTFAQLKDLSDTTASFLLSLNIKKGDMVMLILKRSIEFWQTIIALHKIGAVAIPATHLLTDKDIVYRNNAAGVKAIIAAEDENLIEHTNLAMENSPTVLHRIVVGERSYDGWKDFHKGVDEAVPFVRPEIVNSNDDIMILYFTSGTTGQQIGRAHV